jgi:putative DNA methylase
MSWDYIEINPLEKMSGNWTGGIEWVSDVLAQLDSAIVSSANQQDATSLESRPTSVFFSTDPPYYDNIGYADLSDFFYVWLRCALKPVFPDLFATLTVPKAEELVATPARHGGKQAAEEFFLAGMTRAMQRLAEQSHPAFPVTIYYAFKQAETDGENGTASTGWDTFLDAALRAGFAITGTWPIRTEREGGVRNVDRNSLASSIVLVCRRRAANAPIATRREFITALKTHLPTALAHLQRSNMAPVDLAQAAIGPGMAVYTQYSKVIDAEG